MFKINDYIIYGGNGVHKVIDIGTININGIDKEKLYYTLKPVNSNEGTSYTPVDNEKVVLRKILSKKEALEVIDDIPNIETIYIEDEKQCEKIYKESMYKYDCKQWIRMIKTLYLRSQSRIDCGKKITSTDEKYRHMAEEYLYSEFAITLEIPKEEVEDFILKRLKEIEKLKYEWEK